jgi:hypothetical protein
MPTRKKTREERNPDKGGFKTSLERFEILSRENWKDITMSWGRLHYVFPKT